jgi:hypothetical protein
MPKLIELGLPSLTPEVYSILASQGIISGSYISRFFFFLFGSVFLHLVLMHSFDVVEVLILRGLCSRGFHAVSRYIQIGSLGKWDTERGGCGDIALFGMPESGVEKWS